MLLAGVSLMDFGGRQKRAIHPMTCYLYGKLRAHKHSTVLGLHEHHPETAV